MLGIKFVMVGGVIVNDVYGKNYYSVGIFGCYVLKFELVCFDGSKWVCLFIKNSDWFCVIVGGLGLIGFIFWVEI